MLGSTYSYVIFQLISLSSLFFLSLFFLVRCHKVELLSLTDIQWRSIHAIHVLGVGGKLFFHPLLN